MSEKMTSSEPFLAMITYDGRAWMRLLEAAPEMTQAQVYGEAEAVLCERGIFTRVKHISVGTRTHLAHSALAPYIDVPVPD